MSICVASCNMPNNNHINEMMHIAMAASRVATPNIIIAANTPSAMVAIANDVAALNPKIRGYDNITLSYVCSLPIMCRSMVAPMNNRKKSIARSLVLEYF